ncbi:MAG: DUF427 domain-containing protein [Gammaproteobacteria bacterium]|nr:DUF427 domain-containing protein [Gammaproteobacteria bacterium]
MPATKEIEALPVVEIPSIETLDVEPARTRVRAWVDEAIIVDSTGALVLREGNFSPVYYFPQNDVRMDRFTKTEHSTYCPFKGNASYWTLRVGERALQNVMWSYEHPYEEARQLAKYVAFYTDRLDAVHAEPQGEPDGQSCVPASKGSALKPTVHKHPGSAQVPAQANPLLTWLLYEAPMLTTPAQLTAELAQRLQACGMELARLNVVIRTLHPQIVGHAYRWAFGLQDVEIFPLSYELLQTAEYLNSPFVPIYEGAGGIRRRLFGDAPQLDYPILSKLREEGVTDYVAMPLVFSDGALHVLTLCSYRQGGFTTQELGWLYEVLAVLARLYEVHARKGIALNLLQTYLGPQTGGRVLDGKIRRGDAEDISAVIWFCDLRSSTQLAQRLGRRAFLRLLNEFFDHLAAPIARHGGEILRFIGDAALAIFPIARDEHASCQAHDAVTRALTAVDEAVARVAAMNAARSAKSEITVDFGIGLHLGEVTYGNIGTDERLEFTVIGEAANFAARVEAQCKSLGHNVLLSAAVAAHFPGRFASLGHHELRGVPGKHKLFTLESGLGGIA